MISTLCWVPGGAAKKNPLRYDVSEEELAYIKTQAAEEALVDASIAKAAKGEPDLPPEFEMDKYDEEGMFGGDDDVDAMEAEGTISGSLTADGLMADDDCDSEEADDYTIRQTDALVLVGHTEEDFSCLEVHVYEENTCNLYVHHDITLPAFPLSFAWFDCPPGAAGDSTASGSFVAVGTFKPGIELWNLDVIDALSPLAVLGGEIDEQLRDVATAAGASAGVKKSKKKGQALQSELRPGSHSDAVMALSWNKLQRNLIASGSADTTVKVWDVATGACTHTLRHHRAKVQGVVWHPAEPTVLASAAFDGSIAVLDGRNASSVARFALTADVESLVWDPHSPTLVVASSEDGHVVAYDVRGAADSGGARPVYKLSAHEKSCSSLAFCPLVPGLMATCSVDKTVKLWDTAAAGVPALVASKSMGAGELFTVSFYPSSPFLLAAGGSEGALAIWDTEENADVEARFGARAAAALAAARSSAPSCGGDDEDEEKDENAYAGSGKGAAVSAGAAAGIFSLASTSVSDGSSGAAGAGAAPATSSDNISGKKKKKNKKDKKGRGK